MKPKPETEQELIDLLAQLLDSDDPGEPAEQVDEELRASGLDPDEIGAKMATIAEEAYWTSPVNWRQRARDQRADAEARLTRQAGLRQLRTRDELVRDISAVIARSPLLRGAPRVQAHFRNFEAATEEDLADLLSELEFLEAESSQDGE